MKPTIVAGPAICEWGWTLCRWQGFLRHLSETRKVIVVATERDRFMYEDFAKVIDLKDVYRYVVCDKWTAVNHILPIKKRCENPNLKQKFIKFGRHPVKEANVLIHARNNQSDNRNWPKEKWEQLIQKLKYKTHKIGSIGLLNETYSIKDTMMLQGIDEQYLCNVIAGANVVVGPSSGPMHLASLCGTPHVVWTDKKLWNVGGQKATNRQRYEKIWSPFGTKCTVIDDYSWQPPVDVVVEAVMAYL